jgi:hypothetical protein
MTTRLIKGPEREHHKLAYYEYLDCRDLPEVAKRVSKSYIAVINWFHSFDWAQRAKLHDLEIQKKTEKKLIDDKVKRNVKQLKDLDSMDTIMDQLPKTAFVCDNRGKMLNEDGKRVEDHGGKPIFKLSLESLYDLDRYVNMKLRVQDQRRKIEGEPEVTIKDELAIPQLEPEIAKEAAKLITKLQSEQSIAKKTRP